MLGYYKLCRHYKFALDSIFELYPDSHGVIIVEGKLPKINLFTYIDIIFYIVTYYMYDTVWSSQYIWFILLV